ncbi:MAG: N-acetyltransferase [Planctomycetes bacterium]|nr:N-acetyltransferase [Planctomycetota bacterium]
MNIREEKPEEKQAIHQLVEEAFKTARVRDGSEQDYVDALRAGPNYIQRLALVAEDQGELDGFVMLTRVPFEASGGGEAPVLLLAVLAVKLEKRQQGLGAALVKEALRRAGELGHAAVFVVGDPEYYCRFGFVQASEMAVSCDLAVPQANFLGMELREDIMPPRGGLVRIDWNK